jgi:hypothetical protein
MGQEVVPALPASVEQYGRNSPPWNLHLPGSTRTAHGSPRRFLAPQVGRKPRGKADPSPASPIAFMVWQVTPMPHDGSLQVRSLLPGQASQPY